MKYIDFVLFLQSMPVDLQLDDSLILDTNS